MRYSGGISPANRSVRRRVFLSISSGAAAALFGGMQRAGAATGIAALDTPSIRVKSPASVLLIAVTRAGGRLIAVGEHGVIIYSDDHGETWSQARVPVNLTLTCVAFVTPTIGWAAGHFGVILGSSDGGKTWVTQLNGIEANALTQEAAQGLSSTKSSCPCAPLAITRAAHFLTEGPDKPFLTMLVFSPSRIIVFGAYRMAMITIDGGETWADWSLHIYDKFSHNIYAATPAGGDFYLAGEQGLVFESSDNGNTFLPITSPSSTTLFGILSAPDGSLLVFGVAGACFRSPDGGTTWTRVTLATQDDITAGLILRSGMVLLVSEAGVLFKSTDNGNTFTAVSGVAPRPFFGLVEAENGDVIVVGASGVTKVSGQIFNT